MPSLTSLLGAAALAFQLAQAGPAARRDNNGFVSEDVYKNTYGDSPYCSADCNDGSELMAYRGDNHSFDACYCKPRLFSNVFGGFFSHP